MEKTFYFIAGLPRSGSTLLSAILNQNPRFYSGPNSPVFSTMATLEQSLSNDEHFLAYPNLNQAKALFASVLPTYHSDRKEEVIFDKNRAWPTRLDFIQDYLEMTPKIICPVRNIDEVLASFITMINKNPLQVNGRLNVIDETLVKNNIPLTIENRCQFIAGAGGILGDSYDAIKKLLTEGMEHVLHLVEYEDLVNSPEETMEKIYEFLGEEPFEHTFKNIKNPYEQNDSQAYGLKDMHTVRPNLKITSKAPEEVLPPHVIESCKGAEFWRVLDEED